MHEIPLLVFTFFLQAAIGIMWFLALGKWVYKDRKFTNASILVVVLSIIGVLASLVHLGSPFKALNSLSNLGSSWLSNEVLSVGVFTGIAVLYVVVQLKSNNKSLSMALVGVGSLLGIFAVYSMAKVYSTTSIVAWQGISTFVDFYTTAIALGALLFIVTSLKELQDVDIKMYGFLILAAATLQAAVTIPHALELGASNQDLLLSFSSAIGLKWLLILGGAGIIIWPITQKFVAKKSLVSVFYLAGAALIIGEFIGRYVFFSI